MRPEDYVNKSSNDIANRTGDLPTCSAVSQLTAPSCFPSRYLVKCVMRKIILEEINGYTLQYMTAILP